MNKRSIFAIAGLSALALGIGAAGRARAKEIRKSLKSLGAQPASFSPSWIYKKDSPAVVLIMSSDSSGNGELGTGSIIDPSGHVVTNAHVIINKSVGSPYPVIRVYLKPKILTGDPDKDLKNPYSADIVQYDRSMDLAVLRMRGAPVGLRVMPFGDSGSMAPGDRVVAIGHPEEGGLWTLTQGVVSTVMANFGGVAGKNVFQTDASINRGNSGGPLIDRYGRMIGINTAMARKAPDGLTITSVNFAIQSAVVESWLNASVSDVAYTDVAGPPGAALQQEVASAPSAAPPSIEAASQAAPAAAAASAPSPESHIVTRKNPYQIDALIRAQIAKMQRMGSGMKRDIERKLKVKPRHLQRHNLGGKMDQGMQELDEMGQGGGQN